ncbi:uncharacterized protein FIBRA_04785 [Fibroporia radiculosa]|uniref:CDP-diacylglycerol--glycerol-3-phosphate 3-phosphatidyltransferase n=1 Tax=Fibroporia radiculosa TaxID=599839 RepID=J4GPT5_9APHY|nr:uncharacterized protein FIBRA_04785 [Fibroporia radiculosa]CCM02680.1 predicted protein [Fibroporia radiculosa]
MLARFCPRLALRHPPPPPRRSHSLSLSRPQRYSSGNIRLQLLQPHLSKHPWTSHTRLFSVYRPLHSGGGGGDDQEPPVRDPKPQRENIYTIPNVLTVSRIAACPVLGWAILHGNFELATALLVYAGLTDTVDGYVARRFAMTSVLGSILDPAADKALMTTLTVTLAVQGMIPVPLAAIILGRDVLLSFSAFYIRYTSLPPPKTWSRYWDFSLPSAEVHPTRISKVTPAFSSPESASPADPLQINTLLQLVLMASTTVSPVLAVDISPVLTAFQWVVATTTVWSGASYLFTKDAVRVLSPRRRPPP